MEIKEKNHLHYTIQESELKGMGYTFQKLYARNYKCYHKKFKSGHTFWLWVAGKSIEINDWHHNTIHILNFYKANRNHPKFDELSYANKKPLGYIKVQMNPETGYVQMYDYEEYSKVFVKSKDNIENPWKEWEEKYGNWQNEIILYKESIDILLEEIKKLNPEF